MSNSIEEIASVIGAKRIGNHPAQIDWILTDSRSLCFPEETLFFALKTKRNDGHKYIADLYERGVRNFVVGTLTTEPESYPDANFLVVGSPLKAGFIRYSVQNVSLPVRHAVTTHRLECLFLYG